ncbi:phospholipase D-like domain-containing protein [Crenobacter sp. SG2303]|uniref:Phospholipase D-like domain-containing protein n=1 Tax=Crenobacter oryzisoli TaxID=3056844 RepID=A0ABT7XS72_9NEIS|nr:phospholipase D-like domain-containing protein [Crenobacter sp. SG2303]MDN0076639.1 phospholipase D-like domain-containing protein [Crenobacter sp. SG2303]
MHKTEPVSAKLELIRQLADQAFSRSAGAPLVNGNRVELLFDSTENFPAWKDAIAGAKESVLIEMYIFANNRYGRQLRELLAERATAGVKVRLLYDWLGSWKEHLTGFFKPIVAAGGEVRAFNPPSLVGGLSLLGRDHRKLIVVDGQEAFVSGLCVSSLWEGNPARQLPPWRDTGLRLAGPLVADAIAAFADSWESCGTPLSDDAPPPHAGPTGPVAARLIATTPATANVMRLDLMIASFARRTLWLTDAYFIGAGTYLAALQNAARDGVDVRLLVPRSSDIGWIATVSRTLYRPLLEAGVRVFEWNGPMIHAKTAVADGRWARIGSTNLNASSWLANREIDVAIEDEVLASQLASKFLQDLQNATEVVLAGPRQRPTLTRRRPRDVLLPVSPRSSAAAGASAAARQAARIGDAVGAVVRGSRNVDASEAASFLTIGLSLLALALAIGFFPYLVAAPLTLLLVLTGGAITVKALGLYRARRRKKQHASQLADKPAPTHDDSSPMP